MYFEIRIFFKSWHAIINIFRFSPKNKRNIKISLYLKTKVYYNQPTKLRFSPFYQWFTDFCFGLCYPFLLFRRAVFFISSTFSASGSTRQNDTVAMEKCGEGLGHTTPDCHQLSIWIFWQILAQEPVRPHSRQVPLQRLQWWPQRGCSLGELEVEEFCERKTI